MAKSELIRSRLGRWLSPSRDAIREEDDLAIKLEFLYRTRDSFSSLIQFSDAKAAVSLTVVGAGTIDLLTNTSEVFKASHDGALGVFLFVLFWIACSAAIISLGAAASVLLPRLRPSTSLGDFAVVGDLANGQAYLDAVTQGGSDHLMLQVALEVWELAQILLIKLRLTRVAMIIGIFFLALWISVRILVNHY